MNKESKQLIKLLDDCESFAAGLAIAGSMTPESWVLLDKLHCRIVETKERLIIDPFEDWYKNGAPYPLPGELEEK